MSNKEQTKKLNVLQACEHFKMWTRQPKLKVANLIEWQQFAPNTGKITPYTLYSIFYFRNRRGIYSAFNFDYYLAADF